jgi:GT2 family glycosyltransferase
MVDLSVVIVNYRSSDYVRRCLASLAAGAGAASTEVFVVDNSPGELGSVAQGYDGLRLIENTENVGFGRACNQALRLSRGRVGVLLNPDTELCAGTLETLLKLLENDPGVGVVAPRLVNPDGTLQPSCRPFYSLRVALMDLLGISSFYPRPPLLGRVRWGIWDPDRVRDVSQPMGACMCVRREVLETVGMLDERFFVYFEDVDWCLRIHREGWRIVYTPEAEVIHHEGRSAARDTGLACAAFYRSKLIFCRKHFRGAKLACLIFLMRAEIRLKMTAWRLLASLPGAPPGRQDLRRAYLEANRVVRGSREASA